METFKRILLIALAVLLAIMLSCAAIAGTFLWQLSRKTAALHDDCSRLAGLYPQAVWAGPEEAVTQEISCGYAVMEMFGAWAGTPVTEEALFRAHGSVVTSTASGFAAEMNRVFPQYHTEQHSWLKDSELLETVYGNLEAGIPVPISWAAELDGSWTLHYSLVVGMDLPGDRVTVLNPYGYREALTVRELLSRTSFESFTGMPLWMKMAFALDVFQKNTVFTVR